MFGSNGNLFFYLRNRAIRQHYGKLKTMFLGPLNMADIRKLLADIWCIGDESVKKIVYQREKKDIWL